MTWGSRLSFCFIPCFHVVSVQIHKNVNTQSPIRSRVSVLQQLLFLPSLKLLRFALDWLDEQRQTRVHRFLCCRSVTVISLLGPCCFLFGADRRRLLSAEHVLHPPLLLLSSELLLSQDAVGASGLLVAGVGRVQVEEVGREHGLEPRIFNVHLNTNTRGSVQVNSNFILRIVTLYSDEL